MKVDLKYFFLILVLLLPIEVMASDKFSLKEGLNIIAIDLGGSTENEQDRANGLYGDATLIEQNGNYLLIDTGGFNSQDEDTSDNIKTIINFLKLYEVSRLSIYLSHYHADHYGMIKSILNDSYFTVDKIYFPNPSIITNKLVEGKEWYDLINERVTWANNYLNYLDGKETDVVIIEKGTKINIGEANLNVIWDLNESSLDVDEMYNENPSTFKNRFINDTSLVSMITYKGVKYLNAGDIEISTESEILSNNLNIKADIFKFSHHGSLTSNTLDFIEIINPTYAYLPDNYFAGNNYIKWYGDRGVRYLTNVTNLAAKTNILSTLYNGNILYNISPNGKITVDVTRNSHMVNVKYVDIGNNAILPNEEYLFNDKVVFHLSSDDYIKVKEGYKIYNISNYKDNYVLNEDKDITCYYIEEGEYEKGDINVDGIVNKNDVHELAHGVINKDIFNEGIKYSISDANSDGELKTNDILLLLNKINS